MKQGQVAWIVGNAIAVFLWLAYWLGTMVAQPAPEDAGLMFKIGWVFGGAFEWVGNLLR